jgi:hypothetical protein
MGSGKTFYIMNEVIPISQLPSVHLVLFVGRKDQDPTVKATIPLLGCPIKFTDYEDAEEDIIEIFEAKRCYNYLRDHLEENGWLDSWRDHFNEENLEKLEDKVFEELKVSDFSLPYLDTIIIFDDVGSSNLFRKNTYLSHHMIIPRDDLATYFLATHEISDLDSKIKTKAKVFVLLRGIPRERLVIIRREMSVPWSWEEFLNTYEEFSQSGHHYLVIDQQEGTVSFQD